jgi:uncharacterized membrane protein YkvA (DUF1232 family)
VTPEKHLNGNSTTDYLIGIYKNLRNFLLNIFDRLRFHRLLKEILLFPLDLFTLLVLLLKDQRVSIWSRLELILGLLYIIWPSDIIPDYLPGIGILDDLLIFLIVLNRIFTAAGKVDAFLLKEYWMGDSNTRAVVRGFFSSSRNGYPDFLYWEHYTKY